MRPHAISCIIPTFNSADYLRGALESVFSQTYSPAEIIIADAGSTDGTRELAQEFGEWVRLLWHPRKPRDLTLTRQLGVHFATGDFVALLDPTARWRPDKLARQLARFEARPELDVSVTAVAVDLELEDFASNLEDNLHMQTDLDSVEHPLRYAGSTLLARRELLVSSRGRAVLDALEPLADETALAGLKIERVPEILTHLHAEDEPEPARRVPLAAPPQLQRVRSLFRRQGGLLNLADRGARRLWAARASAR
ncbi:MAG: glycosyltransferase family 2 protein [Myxococcales bacterium]|nr:glycosyltransferase family 2 protein [Myxococcales bacterium]